MKDNEIVFDFENRILTIDGVNVFDNTESFALKGENGVVKVSLNLISHNVKFRGSLSKDSDSKSIKS